MSYGDCKDPRPHKGDYELDFGCPFRDTGTRWEPDEAYKKRLEEVKRWKEEEKKVADLASWRRRRDRDRAGRVG